MVCGARRMTLLQDRRPMAQAPSREAPRYGGRRQLLGNSAVNLVGQLLPMMAALVAIPLLVDGLGTDRFGILAIAWALVGYLTFLDLGLGRGVTKEVAEAVSTGREADVPRTVWAGLAGMTGFAVIGALGFALAAGPLVEGVLNVPPALRDEARATFYLLAASLPFVVTSSGFRGLLEAQMRFGLVNAIRIPMGLLSFLGPVATLPFSEGTLAPVGALVASRVVAWIAFLVAAMRTTPRLWKDRHFDRTRLGRLLRYGGWVTVSSVVGPLMLTFDRFVIGAILTLTAITFYTTPYDAVTRLLFVPAALMSVAFPIFAGALARGGAAVASDVGNTLRYISLVMLPVSITLVAGAPYLLDAWLGGRFPEESSPTMQYLAVGIFLNSLAMVPFALLQASGRPDLPAKLHLVELPVYFAVLALCVSSFGVDGAALAWLLRAGVDALLLFVIVSRTVPMAYATARGSLIGASVATMILLLLIQVPSEPRLVIGIVLLLAFVPVAWLKLLAGDERAAVLRRLRS